MKFEDWEPHYLSILEYFGFDRAGDEEAAHILADLIPWDDFPLLRDMIQDQEVTVCGNAPCLKREMDGIAGGTILAADAAADALYAAGIRPDAVFTDLDGAEDSFLEMNEEGTVMVIHAHGDNILLLRRWAPRFTGPVVCTTQAAPFGHCYNFGGFSDGDRPVFAAEEFGAASVTILGFDLDDGSVDPIKRGKLQVARRLLGMLGYDL